jgi:hypothetical protein
VLKSSTYYMNNRKAFKTKINSLLYPTRANWKPRRRHRRSQNRRAGFRAADPPENREGLPQHRHAVQGLLLYHGLGSGKTCTSIAIAEGMKSEKHVFVLDSLRDNFSGVEEVQNLLQKNQFWELEDTVGQPDKKEALAKQLNIPRKP